MRNNKKEKLANVFAKDALLSKKLSDIIEAFTNLSDQFKSIKSNDDNTEKVLKQGIAIVEALKSIDSSSDIVNLTKGIWELKLVIDQLKKKELPKKFEISNLQGIIEKLDEIKNDCSFTIKNKPKWLKQFDQDAFIKGLKRILLTISKRIINVKIVNKKPISVQLKDNFGNTIEKFGQNPSGAGGGDLQATEKKQDEIIVELKKLLTELEEKIEIIDRTTDNIGVAIQTDALMDDTTVLTPKFAKIDAATSGNNTLVAAVSGKKIRVLALFLVSAGTVNTRFEDDANGTALTGQMNLVVNSGYVLPFNPAGWFETSANKLLNLELSAAVSVDGSLTYIEV